SDLSRAPQESESSAVSRLLRSAGSILRSPRRIVSTVSESAALVLLTDFFSFSRSVGSGSFFPNREIIQSRRSQLAQPEIVADAADELSGLPVIGNRSVRAISHSKAAKIDDYPE